MKNIMMIMILMMCWCGCIVSRSADVKVREPKNNDFSVSVQGFTRDVVDLNLSYGMINNAQIGASTVTMITPHRRETDDIKTMVSNMMADAGFVMLRDNPDFLVCGTCYDARTDWRKWYIDTAVDLCTLFLCMNTRTRSDCEIRIFKRDTGKMVKKIEASDSYQLTSFSLLPVYGHFFTHEIWPGENYSESHRRSTLRAVDLMYEWFDEQKK